MVGKRESACVFVCFMYVCVSVRVLSASPNSSRDSPVLIDMAKVLP